MRRTNVLLVFFVLVGTATLSAQVRKVVDPVDLVNLKQVGDAQIAPDGGAIAYVVTTPVPRSGAPQLSHMVGPHGEYWLGARFCSECGLRYTSPIFAGWQIASVSLG
jgi:hypothetical protein